ncbi:hypothetical protein THAOC_23211 [Thalassiosira oceanica]|uniref:Uncharacterized protein n=1 Tax=Thalassiosira oceanica TaxID=159749 RepID=K0SDV0_THAOC|nr:hypothetical protein THAOC_23211 [Thalassiosira oceanica]|eukprot:EJK56822.1 hypothetical protein THAOC_23211 [Thalassiosira oceanica]
MPHRNLEPSSARKEEDRGSRIRAEVCGGLAVKRRSISSAAEAEREKESPKRPSYPSDRSGEEGGFDDTARRTKNGVPVHTRPAARRLRRRAAPRRRHVVPVGTVRPPRPPPDDHRVQVRGCGHHPLGGDEALLLRRRARCARRGARGVAQQRGAGGDVSRRGARRRQKGRVLASVPSGVNLGGWLSLEDWFYVGDDGAVEVATPDPPSDLVDSGRWKGGGAASCLPPLHVDASTGPRWSSETDLFGGLADHYKEDGKSESESSLGPWGRAYRTVHAARSSYMDYDAEMPLLREIGVEYVRVPVSWCWTEYDPSLMVVKDLNPMAKGDGFIYMDDDEVRDKFACEDPFHKGVYWPAGG